MSVLNVSSFPLQSYSCHKMSDDFIKGNKERLSRNFVKTLLTQVYRSSGKTIKSDVAIRMGVSFEWSRSFRTVR